MIIKIGLVDRAITWHRDEREHTAADMAKELGAETLAALTPVALPNTPEVRFLATVGDICAEGANMEHCIAGYARPAVQGWCYLFHIEKDGEQALVQVNIMGQVVQAHGPRNRHNQAAAWERRVLRRWGQEFSEDIPDRSQHLAPVRPALRELPPSTMRSRFSGRPWPA